MSIFFIEENDKQSILNFKKIIVKNRKIVINRKMKNLNIKQKMKIVNKVREFLLEYKCRRVILTEELKQDREFINLLATNNINVIDGRWLFKMLIPEILDNVIKKGDMKKEEIEVVFVVNEKTRLIEKYIEEISKECKRVGIVTNHLSQFRQLEDELYNNSGILITVTNNRRKSLLKADIIVNVDYPKETLNKFTINDKGVIIDIEGDLKILKKRFCGKIINDFEIDIKDEMFEHWIKNNEIKNEYFNIKDIIEGYTYIYGLNKEKISIK